MIHWSCPYCKEPMEAPESLAETAMKCPICATPCWVPAAPAECSTIATPPPSVDRGISSSQRRQPLVRIYGNRLWMQVASGVCVGLIGFTFFIIYVLPAALTGSSPRRSPANSSPTHLQSNNWASLRESAFRLADFRRGYCSVVWRVTLMNSTSSDRAMSVLKIQFVDAEGFEVSVDFNFRVLLTPGENEVTGSTSMDVEEAGRITEMRVFLTD